MTRWSAIHRASSDWMHRGMALMRSNGTEHVELALECFDIAIVFRDGLPFNYNPEWRFGLCAAWMNRAEALMTLHSPAHLQEAVRCYDVALEHLIQLPGIEPRYLKRHATAWMNRAGVLRLQGTESTRSAALHSLDQCIALLQLPVAAAIPEQAALLGAAWVSRAQVLLEQIPSDIQQCMAAARTALQSVTAAEQDDSLAADVGLNARHLLCAAIARQFAVASPSSQAQLYSDAVDAIHSGLQLGWHWIARGRTELQRVTMDLFRFGIRIRQLHQPKSVIDFIRQTLDEQPTGAAMDGDACFEALRALRWNLQDVQRDSFRLLRTAAFPECLNQLQALRKTEERLRSAVQPSRSAPETTLTGVHSEI